jgi:hypothetical protein
VLAVAGFCKRIFDAGEIVNRPSSVSVSTPFYGFYAVLCFRFPRAICQNGTGRKYAMILRGLGFRLFMGFSCCSRGRIPPSPPFVFWQVHAQRKSRKHGRKTKFSRNRKHFFADAELIVSCSDLCGSLQRQVIASGGAEMAFLLDFGKQPRGQCRFARSSCGISLHLRGFGKQQVTLRFHRP